MRETSHILLGQNVTSDRQKLRNRRLLGLMGACLVGGNVLGWFGGYQLAKAHSAPSWPPAGVTLVPATPKPPQGHRTAYLATDQNFILLVDFEPVAKGRFLGVDPRRDDSACRIHVAAELPAVDLTGKGDSQLLEAQRGLAKCFEVFTD